MPSTNSPNQFLEIEIGGKSRNLFQNFKKELNEKSN